MIRRSPTSCPRSTLAASVIALLIALTTLAGAKQPVSRGVTRAGEGRAERLARHGEHAEAAGAYIALASEAIGSERDRLTLLAVEQWLDAGDAGSRQQRILMCRILTPGQPPLAIWNTNAAALSLYAGAADDALGIWSR